MLTGTILLAKDNEKILELNDSYLRFMSTKYEELEKRV